MIIRLFYNSLLGLIGFVIPIIILIYCTLDLIEFKKIKNNMSMLANALNIVFNAILMLYTILTLISGIISEYTYYNIFNIDRGSWINFYISSMNMCIVLLIMHIIIFYKSENNKL